MAKIPFTSKCPKCEQTQYQPGYDRGSLLRLLNGAHPVEAYCSPCRVYWSISFTERAGLAEAAHLSSGKPKH